MTVTAKTKDLAAEWREARLLHPLYSALAREFVIDLPPCTDLESTVDDPPQESVEHARQWFLEMDQKKNILDTITMFPLFHGIVSKFLYERQMLSYHYRFYTSIKTALHSTPTHEALNNIKSLL